MKKLYFLVLSLLLLTGYTAQSQCTFSSSFATATINPTGAIVTITTCSFAGEYSTINGAVNGQTLNFTFSNLGTGAYITIHSGTPAGPIIASGPSPLSFANTFTGTLYAHWSLNAACGTDGSCHTTTVQCTSCSSPPPANDLCTGAININCAQTISGNTGTATADAVPTCVTTLNSAPGVWYSFAGDGSTVTLSLCGSSYDTKIGVFTGTCASLVCLTGNDDFCGLQSQVTFPTLPGTTYYILVTGFSTNSGAFTLARTCAPPANDLCTGAITINCGQTIVASTVAATTDAATPTCVTALNTAPGVWYSFVGDGQLVTLSLCGSAYDTKIGVFTGTCASLVCVTGNDDFCGTQSQVTFPTVIGTTYYILVTGFSTATGTFTLARTCVPTIPNDLCTGAININCGQTINGTTVGSSIDAATPTCVTALNTAPGVWYSFVGNGAINTLTMCGSAYDTKIGVFTGTCAALVCVTGNDDFCGLQSQVAFPTTLGTTYYIIVTGFSTATGSFTLTRTSDPLPNDVCTGAININCGQTITGSTACGASLDAVPTCVTSLNTAPGLWYQFVGDGSPVTLSLCGSSFDTKIGVFRGTCGALVCVTGNDDFCGLQSQVTFNTNAGFTYYILVTGFSTATGNFTLARTCAPPCAGVPSPGSVTPTTSTVCIGSSVTLTCSGYSANTGLTFQWNQAPAAGGPYTPIAGATSNVYTFTAAATAYYTCTVTCTNAGGGSGTTAPPVVVNVSNPVHTVTAATPNPVCSAGTLTITGTVSGGLNLGNYTHTLTGPGTIGAAVVSGANNSSVSFTVTNMPAGNQNYILTSTDPLGCSKATTIPVTVNQTPVVTFAPANPTICNGAIQAITGTVSTGAGTFVLSPLTELYTDAAATVAYTGTALASGTTIYAKPTVTRTYTATVTSAQGCTSTTTITVTVNQLPAITVQPTPATQTICPGFNVVYTVGATGAGLTYQWRRNGVNLTNGGNISGATTNTLTLTAVTTANSGTYDVVVSGTCPPSVTSVPVVLNIATAPTITTQPANVTACQNANAVFTVVATGVPPPTIYQWQVSTNGGVTWTDLTTGGSYTSTFTITGVTLAMNGNQYRVIVTNSCNQAVTSNVVTLTVNPAPANVVATDLFNRRICLSDTLIPLVGTPIGGTWSGIGVSGFNFIPSASGIGTFILTYTYTNSFGCTASDTTKVIVSDCGERIRLLGDDAVLLFPNPNNGRFNIKVNSTLYNYLGMKVYNSSGQLMNGTTVNRVLTSPVYNGLVYGRVIPIDISYLPAGIYLVKFYYDDGIRTSEKTFTVSIVH